MLVRPYPRFAPPAPDDESVAGEEDPGSALDELDPPSSPRLKALGSTPVPAPIWRTRQRWLRLVRNPTQRSKPP